MKAGILYNASDIRVGEAPDPKIRPDEVLIESNAGLGANYKAGFCIFG